MVTNKGVSLKRWFGRLETKARPRVFGSLDSLQIETSLRAYPRVRVRVPLVVDICCSFLRENATSTKGVFRVNGSLKRIQSLQQLFESKRIYKNTRLDQLGFTVFDVAGVLMRYLKCLRESVIPAAYVLRFRQVSPLQPVADQTMAYRSLVNELPLANGDLLMYLLDFLAEMAKHANHTLMSCTNLASVFQPTLLFLPQHAMDPYEYKRNQLVVLFLISNFASLADREQRPASSPVIKRLSTSSILRNWLIRSNSRPPSI
ncbi:GTPase activating protein (GAP) for Rho1p [Massospora cicadina]|nr:GTPase activating protein (GAP) for Rho1p [Massospora cicadina]